MKLLLPGLIMARCLGCWSHSGHHSLFFHLKNYGIIHLEVDVIINIGINIAKMLIAMILSYSYLVRSWQGALDAGHI